MHEDHSPTMFSPASEASPGPELAPGVAPEELVLDGVRYVDLRQGGRSWRLGALNPLWRQELLALDPNPHADQDAGALAALEARGLWLAWATDAPPLAVMCCGLGAVWPGMGRELYDGFPAARAAMDRIAAVADWDVLALMDETDVEKISLTRWQSPYLFMLEYAQWSYLASLGLRPSLFCGHSLGELIALCFAGIYAPEVAWYILDTRAVHMAELEAKATRETGMMAVHAGADIIEDARAAWPLLYVSNYNTPNQFILSGPREVLLEARKSLRKRRIPAIMLNVSLAFHHPSMRVLRDLSLRRLNALEMHAPRVPMLSCISTGFYPGDQPSICRYIADLDENSVRWTECVRAMWARDGIRHFLELGPQDTLCGLAVDNEPRALCLAAGRKGKETEGLRQACARLYALGHLPRAAVRARVLEAAGSGARHEPAPQPPAAQDFPAPNPAPAAAAPAVCDPENSTREDRLRVVLRILAQACDRPVEELRPEMDLRYDLALRSSRFPLIIQEVERALGLSVNFEDLLQVATIGDLARILGMDDPLRDETAKGSGAGSCGGVARVRAVSPLCRFAPPLGQGAAGHEPVEQEPSGRKFPALEPLPLDPCGRGLPLRSGDVLALCVLAPGLLPRLLSGLAPLGCALAVPRDLLEACAPLAKAGSRLIPLDFDAHGPVPAEAQAVSAAIRALAEQEGRVDGLLLAAALPDARVCPETAPSIWPNIWPHTWPDACLRPALEHGLRYACSCLVLPSEPWAVFSPCPVEQALLALDSEGKVAARAVRLLDDGQAAGLNELGDMLARELLRGTRQRVIWARESALRPQSGAQSGSVGASRGQSLRVRPECFPLVFPDPHPALRPTATLLQGACQFSRFADPLLAVHGGQPGNALGSALGANLPWLPVSRALQAILEGSRLLLPWLAVTGLSDVRFYEPPLLPPGVTRECRLLLEAEPWLMQDRVMTRMCRGKLTVRGLTANGRHTDQYAPVAGGMVLLAAACGQVPPLWPVPAVGEAAAQRREIGHFYDALGLGFAWRLLTDFAVLPDGMFHAALAAPAAIAPESDWGYTDVLHVVEGIIQAAWLAIGLQKPDGSAGWSATAVANVLCWRLNAAGFIRFQGERGSGPWRLQLRRSWADGKLLRFDAQAVDARGRIFLTLHHLEFDRRDAVAPSGEAVRHE